MAASGHDLRKCLAVLHPFRFPLSDKFPFGFRFRGLAACAMFFNRFVFGLKDFPAVAYAQLVDSLGNELLHVETVIDQGGTGKGRPYRQHHRGG